MKLDRIVLRKMTMSLKAPFETSFGVEQDRGFILVEVYSGDLVGYGECVVSNDPYYSPETIGTGWHIMKDFLIPRLLGREWEHPGEIIEWFEPVRGHMMAKAGLEVAAWDLYAQAQGISVAQALGGTRESIAVGISVGIQRSIEATLTMIEAYLAQGFQRIKVKIKPGWDLGLVEAIRNRFGAIGLQVDANSAYSLADLDLFRELDRYRLLLIEQPLAHDDIVDHARLQARIETPVCLDESIESPEDARKALDIGACKVINIKVGRVGGLQNARAIEALCRERKVPVWCGGMLESGVGRAHNVAIASLAGFTLPGDTAPSSRYWEEDIIEPLVSMEPDGTIKVPFDKPGRGFEVIPRRVERYTVFSESFHA